MLPRQHAAHLNARSLSRHDLAGRPCTNVAISSQHFQGLRRAQNKAEVTAIGIDGSPRRLDPNENPITRRPGPGRGRPRKQPAAGGAGPSSDSAQMQPQGQGQVPDPGQVQSPLPGPTQSQGQLQPQPAPPMMDNGLVGAPVDQNSALPDGLPHEPEDELDEPHAKRPRLDENTDPSLEDEAVMNALAAHSNSTPVDAYGTE